jgi:peptide-methionine (R)-S-oxide reductase
MTDSKVVSHSNEEWRKKLTPEQYRILREKGTEAAFTGKFNDHFDAGMYICAACGAELFGSNNKFESGCGWPAFDAPAKENNIAEEADTSHGMVRTEVKCARCGGHLGHVFPDGPTSTGQRYCINSAALDFKGKEK